MSLLIFNFDGIFASCACSEATAVLWPVNQYIPSYLPSRGVVSNTVFISVRTCPHFFFYTEYLGKKI